MRVSGWRSRRVAGQGARANEHGGGAGEWTGGRPHRILRSTPAEVDRAEARAPLSEHLHARVGHLVAPIQNERFERWAPLGERSDRHVRHLDRPRDVELSEAGAPLGHQHNVRRCNVALCEIEGQEPWTLLDGRPHHFGTHVAVPRQADPHHGRFVETPNERL
jgi:hypothetical protein